MKLLIFMVAMLTFLTEESLASARNLLLLEEGFLKSFVVSTKLVRLDGVRSFSSTIDSSKLYREKARYLMIRHSKETDASFGVETDTTKLDVLARMSPKDTLPKNPPLLDMTPVKDQDALGTCTSFAMGAATEFHYRNNVSEAEASVNAEKHGGDCLTGLTLGNAICNAYQRGLVDHQYWEYETYVRQVCKLNNIPYEDRRNKLPLIYRVCVDAPSPLPHDVKRYKTDYASYLLRPRDEARKELEEGEHSVTTEAFKSKIWYTKAFLAKRKAPVLAEVATLSHCGWDDMFAFGNIKFPSKIPPFPLITGWHTITFTGYDDDKQAFRFKNSWGSWWGDGTGYGWMSYNYFSWTSVLCAAILPPK